MNERRRSSAEDREGQRECRTAGSRETWSSTLLSVVKNSRLFAGIAGERPWRKIENSVVDMQHSASPQRFGRPNRLGKCRWIFQRKISMPVIQKNCDRTVQQRGGHDNIEKIVAVHISRRELQSANRSHDAYGLPRAGAQLESDPVARL